jgi:hypothetical protein
VMALTRVTITGADDGVDPKELVRLSDAYPFVEWGILRSTDREGTARYPSAEWRSTLWVVHKPNVRFSAHLCGRLSRKAMAGANTWSGESSRLDCSIQYQRVQLNGFSSYVLPMLLIAERHPGTEFILQCSDAAALDRAAKLAAHYNVTALFDPSGGQGIPFGWIPGYRGLRLGYAGGINPLNVADVAEDMAKLDRDVWIDMESGVRTDDRFDLDKVTRVLELAAQFVRAS